MLLRWLISALGFAALKGEATSIAERVKRRALVVALLAVLWLTAFGFALAALAVWLAGTIGVIAACGVIAAILALIGLAVQLTVMLSDRRKPASGGLNFPFPGLTANTGDKIAGDGANLGSMAMVAVAGYLLGRQMFGK